MSHGAARLGFAGLGHLLRWLAKLPIGCGEILICLAARCERRARAPLNRRPGR